MIAISLRFLSLWILGLSRSYYLMNFSQQVSAATWKCMNIVGLKMLLFLPEIFLLFCLIFCALERFYKRYTATFMPKKCRNFKLVVLVHVHAVANNRRFGAPRGGISVSSTIKSSAFGNYSNRCSTCEPCTCMAMAFTRCCSSKCWLICCPYA